jgi:hypothetical protein
MKGKQIVMLKPYTIIYKFFYNNKIIQSHICTKLLNEPHEEVNHYGADFEGLWKLANEKPVFIPIFTFETKKGKRYMQFWDAIFSRITEKNCKPWRFVISCYETTLSMDELMKFETEDVIQYLKERGMNTCPLKGE